MAAFQNTIRMFDGLMYVVVIVAGGIFMIKGLIDPGDLVAYTMYVTTLLATIRRIIEFAEQFQRGMTGIERFSELMDASVDIFDEEGAVPLRDVHGSITFDVGRRKDDAVQSDPAFLRSYRGTDSAGRTGY